MANKLNTNFCLSGLQKPISKKDESLKDKIMEKVRLPTLQFSKLDVMRKQRPKTAVKKKTSSRSSSSSRPPSATIKSKVEGRVTMKRPNTIQSGSVDSAISSHQSSAEPSTDEENDCTDDRFSNQSTDDLSEDECSVDSGIIKVRISRTAVNRCEGESCEDSNAATPSPCPTKAPILVKEFNRTPDIPEKDTETEIGKFGEIKRTK